MLSQVGFPKELKNEIDYSLPANVSSYSVKVVPSNVASIASPPQLTGTAAGAVSLNGTSQNVIFDIPAGQGKGIFIDPRFTTLNFRVNYAITVAGVQVALTSGVLRSGAMAHWDREYIQSQSGVVLDDINLLGVVQDQLQSLEIDVAQRDALSMMYGYLSDKATDLTTGYSLNLTNGHVINGWDAIAAGAASPAAITSNYYSYSVPLLNSLIGKGASKFFQIGATGKLQLVLQTAAILPITLILGAPGTSPSSATVQVTIDNISLNLQYVDIGMEGVKMLDKTGLQYYNGITYRASTATLPSTSGAVSLLTGLRGSSVRTIMTRCTESGTLSTAGCINYLYDSKLPQATSIQYNVNGVVVPPNPVDLLHAPATAYSFLQEANGSFNTYEFKSGLTPDRYCVYVAGGTVPSDSDRRILAQGNTSNAYNQAQFAFGYNLEKVSKAGILDGMNLNSGNTFLNMVLANSSTNTLTFIFIAKMDIIYILDTATGEISVRM